MADDETGRFITTPYHGRVEVPEHLRSAVAAGAFEGVGLLPNVDDLSECAIPRIWWMPTQGPAGPALLIEVTGGYKRYRRVWVDKELNPEWTWFKPDDAVLLSGDPEPAG